MTPAEFFLAVIVARRADQEGSVSDATWEEWTGRDVRTKQNAVCGLREKKLLNEDKRGRYSLDVRSFSSWARHADPHDTRTAGRGPTKAPELKIHPDCASGCAMSSGRAQLIPLAATEITKPVSSAVQRGADSAGTPLVLPHPAAPKNGQKAERPFEASQDGWWKTLAAMREAFSTAGVALLMRLVAVVLALVPDVTDAEMAAAIRIAWAEKRGYQKGPELFVSTVPDTLLSERARRASALPATPFTKPVSLTVQEQADFDTKEARFALWDRVCSRHKVKAHFDMRAIAEDPELDALGRKQAEGMIARLGRFTNVPL